MKWCAALVLSNCGSTQRMSWPRLDARVRLRALPAQRLAVIRFSGFWSESNYLDHLGELKAALRAARLAWSGEPIYSRYYAPSTPWFLRRNEIWLKLDRD